jgi:hypothetical protein
MRRARLELGGAMVEEHLLHLLHRESRLTLTGEKMASNIIEPYLTASTKP